MKQTELSAGLGQLNAQLLKAKREILDKVKSLEDAVTTAQDGDLDPAVVDAFNQLRGEVQDIDDLNPDPVTPTPPAEGTPPPASNN